MMDSRFLVKMSHSKETDRLGTKGENLRTLLRLGFAIPETYGLTADAYELFLKKNELWSKMSAILCNYALGSDNKADTIRQMFLDAPVPKDITEAILEQETISRGTWKWAVRSSSNFEDLKEASFAGLHDTYLNIEGYDHILEAIKKCWISLWSERAIVYRERHGVDHGRAVMAVLIQRMIEARWSGVAFTVHPSPGEPGKMLIEYCEGIGDALVSGRITPKTVSIERETMTVSRPQAPEPSCLVTDQILKLGDLSLGIEKAMGSPQDIEWAHDGVSFSILQSRPMPSHIRSLNITPNLIWTRANIGEVLPDAVTPLTWAVFRSILEGSENSKQTNEEEMGSEENNQIALIKGRGYIRLDLFLDSFCYLPFVGPEIMDRVLGVQMPVDVKDYKRPKGIAVNAARVLFLLALSGFLPRLSLMIRRLPDLAEAKNGGFEKTMEWNRLCFRIHFKCTAYAIGAFAFLVHCLRRWLPGDADGLIPLIMIGNADLQTAEQGTTLLGLVQYVNQYPDLRRLISNNQDWRLLENQLAGIDGGPEFLSLLKDFLVCNGARAAGEFELALPRWREDPSFVMMIVQRFLGASASSYIFPDRRLRLEKHEKTVRRIGDQLTPLRRWMFFRLLNAYRKFSTLRENMKYRLMEGYGELRNYFLDTGKALMEASVLREGDDIFFLKPHEIEGLISGRGPNGTIAGLIGERKQQYEMSKREQAPDLVFHDMSAGSFSVEDSMHGIGCSPGVAKGCARVLRDISETKLLEPGEILVASHTDPGWTPLFLICKGLVTETGGFLSHGATVAREYGIPAVVSVPGVTEKIQTGDLVVVNGNNGVVTIMNKDTDMQCRNKE
ncbi:MAG: Phosphoenolpyruvate synthase [Syntrophorhabdus sp. PtaU1.Bin002]|nr:MAG: Phosphoenolpyruvate synthase [Syntrophorhabdus sp. PtaU1.Bin002]